MPSFSQNGVDGYTLPTGTSVQINYINCYEKHEKYFSYGGDFIYFVIEGNGLFKIGENLFTVAAGDTIKVPKNTKATYKGNMKLLLIIENGFHRELSKNFEPTDL